MASTESTLEKIKDLIDFVQNASTPGGQEYITLSSGYQMPILGLGTWQSDTGLVARAVEHALDVGYRHFDCAWIYGNENEVGEGLANKIADGTVRREEVFITSKLWNSYHHPDDAEDNIRETLSRLNLDYLDLYLVHWPIPFQRRFAGCPMDENGLIIAEDIPIMDTWRAMERLVDLGLTKSIGLSNFNPEMMSDILQQCRIPPTVNQCESHPYLTQPHWVEFCQKNNIAFEAYSPLGNPARPDCMKRRVNLCELDDPILKGIARKYNKSVAQVCIKYQVQRGCVVIPKSTTPHRIDENFNIWDFRMSDEDMEAIGKLNRNWRFCLDDGTQHHPLFPFWDELPRRLALANNDLIPFVGLDTSVAGDEQIQQLVENALTVGFRLFDCSSRPETEKAVGAGIKSGIARGLVTREDVRIVGKLSSSYHHPDDVETALKATLANLQVDYLDVYLMENPFAFSRGKYQNLSQTGNYEFDPNITLEATYQAMISLVRSGLVRSIGVANVNISQVQRLCRLDVPPSLVQNECHLYNRNDELLEFCLNEGIAFQATKPCGPKRAVQEEAVLDIANWRGKTPEQILIRWQIERDCTTLVQPRTPEMDEIRTSFEVFGFRLGPAVCEKISGCTNQFERLSFIRGTQNAPEFPFADVQG